LKAFPCFQKQQVKQHFEQVLGKEGAGDSRLQLTKRCKWRNKLKPKAKSKKIPSTKMKTKKSPTEFWNLTNTLKGLK